MKPIEYVYLAVGLGIIVHGSIDHMLTVQELGAGMFFIGLIPVSRTDRGERPLPIVQVIERLFGLKPRNGDGKA